MGLRSALSNWLGTAPSRRRGPVLIATRIYPPEPAIAAQMQSYFAAALARRSLPVHVLTTTFKDAPRRESRGAIRISRWPALRDSDYYIRGIIQYLSFDIPLFFRILCYPTRPAAVLLEPPPTTGCAVRVACWLRRVPYIYHLADLWSEAATTADAPRPVLAALRHGENWAIAGADLVLAVHAEIAAQLGERLTARDLVVIGQGVDTVAFTPDCPPPPGDSPAAHTPQRLVYGGTASTVHGARIFLDAFAKIRSDFPAARLVFIGQGSDFPAFTAAAAQPDSQIEVHPRTDEATMARWLNGAAAALASVAPGPYDFAFPTKAFAAAACNTPVIYSGGPSAKAKIAAAGIGYACDYDVDEVAAAMRQALSQPWPGRDELRLRQWAVENASLTAVADRVAVAVSGLLPPRNRAARPREQRKVRPSRSRSRSDAN